MQQSNAVIPHITNIENELTNIENEIETVKSKKVSFSLSIFFYHCVYSRKHIFIRLIKNTSFYT